MYQKDYLLKHIEGFFNAIKEILLNIKNEDNIKAQKQITNSFLFFNNSESFFVETEVNEIVKFLNNEENGLEKTNLLAELFLTDAKINLYRRKKTLSKAIFLLEYYSNETKTISLDTMNKISRAKKELAENL
jgi:hypothetical protein